MSTQSKVIPKPDDRFPEFSLIIHSMSYPWQEHNGHYEWLWSELKIWTRKYVKDDDVFNKLIEENFGGYGTCLMFRRSVSKERLLNTAKMLIWSIVSDDLIEEIQDKYVVINFIQIMKQFNEHLQNHAYDPNDPVAPKEAVFRMYGDAMQSMKDTGFTPFQQKRFAKSYFDVLNENYKYKARQLQSKTGHFKNIDDYMIYRRRESFMEVGFAPGEYAYDLSIDEETYNSPQFKNVIYYATEITCGVNDICSFIKEERNDYACRNYIKVYSETKNVSIMEAYDALLKYCKEMDIEFRKSLENLLSSNLILQCPDVVIFGKYLILDVVYGMIQFQDFSGRYRANCKSKTEIINPYLTKEKQLELLGKTYFD